MKKTWHEQMSELARRQSWRNDIYHKVDPVVGRRRKIKPVSVIDRAIVDSVAAPERGYRRFFEDSLF